jgi:hypothetical protein
MSAGRSSRPLRLDRVWHGRFRVAKPFSFLTTVRKPSHFPTPLEVFPDTANYMVAADVGGELFGVHATQTSPDTVDLSVYGRLRSGRGEPEVVAGELARRLGLLVDVSGFESIWQRDPRLSSLWPELPVDARRCQTRSTDSS